MPNPSLIKSPIVNNSYQSILDVFLLQGLINYQDYQSLKGRLSTNSEVEAFLIKNKLLSRESINRAYSIIYKMPFIDLKNLEVEKELLSMVPESTAKSLQIAPFAINNQILNLAVARPGSLPADWPSIEKLFIGRAKAIFLYITSPDDIESVFRNSGKGQLIMTKAKYPTVYLKNQIISKNLLTLLPPEFMSRYHLVIFGKREENDYMIATDRIDNPETLKAVELLEKENKIFLEIFATSSEDLSYIFNLMSEPETESKTVKSPAAPVEKQNEEKSILSNLKDIFSGGGDRPPITIDAVHKAVNDLPRAENSTLNQAPTKLEEKATNTEVVQFKETPENENIKDDGKNVANLVSTNNENIGSLLDKDITSVGELNKIIASGEVPKIVAAAISLALESRASDIHFEPEEKEFRMRFRVDGILQDITAIPKEMQQQIVSRIKILSNLKLDENRIPQDGRFDVQFQKRQVDIRVSSLPTVRGEKVVMRLLDKSQGMLSLEDLGMEGQAFEKTLEAIKKPHGIIISTGPTGSGKSTTLYAVLNRISVPSVNIVTLEDPVEYEIPGVNQCQIKPKIGFTFADGLRSILRQDPNVIMVGEVRDLETANMATHAALTGHLVLTTLHTNDAAGALPRLTNMGVEPFLITSSINLIIGQRLVRRICPKCREEINIPNSLKKQLEEEISKIPVKSESDKKRVAEPHHFYQGKGCQECNQGYKGRLGIFEVLDVSDKIEEQVIAKTSANEILRQAMADGMVTMRQDGLMKALAGLTTVDEVFRVTTEL